MTQECHLGFSLKLEFYQCTYWILPLGTGLHDWGTAVITSHRSETSSGSDYPHLRKGQSQESTDLRSGSCPGWGWQCLGHFIRYFPMADLSGGSAKKTPAAHGGILEPAPSAGAQHFFTHKTSNSDQIMISLLPGTARATAGRDLVSQARAISSCTALVPAPMGENSLIFSLSAFLLFSFGHFSPFPASPSKVNQAPHEMHLTVPQRHPKMFELTVCLSQENLSYARATKTALTLKTSSVALQGSCFTSSDLWILTWPLWVEGCFKMHTCNNHQVVWDKKSPKNQFIA